APRPRAHRPRRHAASVARHRRRGPGDGDDRLARRRRGPALAHLTAAGGRADGAGQHRGAGRQPHGHRVRGRRQQRGRAAGDHHVLRPRAVGAEGGGRSHPVRAAVLGRADQPGREASPAHARVRGLGVRPGGAALRRGQRAVGGRDPAAGCAARGGAAAPPSAARRQRGGHRLFLGDGRRVVRGAGRTPCQSWCM
ncbi:MAG: Acetyltransferase, GNAT family, partial [uncultured Nocardioidaceae bacterium]